MKQPDSDSLTDDLRAEYDLRALLKQARPNPYAERYAAGTNIVLLAPDVAEAFKDSDAVNEALRLVMKLSRLPDSHWRETESPPVH
ncbi:MAG: hypothetical protein HZB53_03130 [Chloroflexi bacterium]|nr:hypothetical protein [Chloroflexota bacterium]